MRVSHLNKSNRLPFKMLQLFSGAELAPVAKGGIKPPWHDCPELGSIWEHQQNTKMTKWLKGKETFFLEADSCFKLESQGCFAERETKPRTWRVSRIVGLILLVTYWSDIYFKNSGSSTCRHNSDYTRKASFSSNLLCALYLRGLKRQILCTSYDLKVVCTPNKGTKSEKIHTIHPFTTIIWDLLRI